MRRLIVALVFLAACVGVPAAAGPKLPRVTVCGDPGSLRPKFVLLGCGDGGQFVDGVLWSSWTATEAKGTGDWWRNLCTPDCADGHFRHSPVHLTLSRPRLCRRPRVTLFTRLKLVGADGRPTVARIPYAGTTTCP
jgi:hypothetical protein